MSRVEAGSTYNSLTDHHLVNYFSRSRPRRQLRQSGLIRRDGEILSEASLYADSLKQDQKRQAKEAILRSLESRKDDLTRTHQALCIRTIEEIEKIERVRRIRSGKRTGCGVSYMDLIDCAIVPASICHRPLTASLTNGKIPSASGNLSYSNGNLLQRRRARSAGGHRGNGCCQEEEDSQYDASSAYLLPVLPRRKSKKRKLRPKDRHQRKNSQSLKPRQTGAEEDDLRLAMVTMKYFGDNIHLENDLADPRVEVLVEQQHCGGNTLVVFKDKLLPGTEFSFPSYRHPGYPFSLTIYVNGRHDSRLSVCCEYKHKINARLGGKGGRFAVVGVKRGMPCHSCMMKYKQKNRKKNKGPSYLNNDFDESSDSRGQSDEETAVSRTFPGHQNRIRIPVDDDENDRDEEYGKEINRRTAEAQSPELGRKARTSSAKKSRDPYDHFLYDIQVPVEDEDNGNNNNAGGVSDARRGSPSREQQMKSPPQALREEESSSESDSESSGSEDDDEEGEEDSELKGSEYTEDIENVKPKSSRSQRESNHEDEPASESDS